MAYERVQVLATLANLRQLPRDVKRKLTMSDRKGVAVAGATAAQAVLQHCSLNRF